MNIETGYFFITDITGYTQFLTRSELDHAKEVLDALFESILHNIEPPLIVSNTQGDAIICYASAAAFHQPRQLLDIMERTYFDFRHRLDLMKFNTTCDCDACVNMAALDLKIFLHYGQYLVQEIGPRTDLQGSDVILAHRLMKNSILESLGLLGYGLLTDAALMAMGVDHGAEGMSEFVEHYEHYGDVTLYVHDLQAAWLVERDRNRIVVTAEEAAVHTGVFVPIPPWVAWDYATSMDLKRLYYDLESIERTDPEGGREKIGSSFHCHHRLGDIDYYHVDYDPPHYMTSQGTGFGITSLITVRIAQVEGGSRFEIYHGHPYGDYDDKVRSIQQEMAEKAVATYAKVVSDDIQAGRIDPDQSEADFAWISSFARPAVAKGRYGNMSGSFPSDEKR